MQQISFTVCLPSCVQAKQTSLVFQDYCVHEKFKLKTEIITVSLEGSHKSCRYSTVSDTLHVSTVHLHIEHLEHI